MPSHSSSSLPPYEPQPSYLRSLMHDYHQQINAQTDATVADLQQRWVSARAAINADIARLQRQMETAIAQGDQITYAWLSDAQRLAALKASVEGNIAQFAEGVRTLVGQGQLSAINLGTTAAQETLAATVPPGVAYTFGVPPADVLHAQAGALQAGSPLAQLFAQMGPEAAKSAQAALFTSVALGEGPRAAAARLFWNSNYTRQRAEVIARTEMLRSWRGAQMENYRANSDVVSGWQWSADFSDRTCGACIAMDGTIHTLDEDLDDHIMGRCSALPVTKPWSDILAGTGADTSGLTETSIASWDSYLYGNGRAADWFDGLAPEVQNSILGPAKAEAYRVGDLTLEQLAGVRQDPVWGDSIQEVSLKQLGLDAQDYLSAARANGTDSVVADAEAQAQAHTGTPAALAHAAQDAPLPQSWVDWAKTQADEWYKSVAAAIDDAGGTAAQAAEAQAQADAWYAQIERSIASGERPPAMADRAWDIRREEAIAVAEGRAEWLPAQATEPEGFALREPPSAATLTREALADKNMAELRQLASEMGVTPARSKAETIDRLLAKDAKETEQPTPATRRGKSRDPEAELARLREKEAALVAEDARLLDEFNRTLDASMEAPTLSEGHSLGTRAIYVIGDQRTRLNRELKRVRGRIRTLTADTSAAAGKTASAARTVAADAEKTVKVDQALANLRALTPEQLAAKAAATQARELIWQDKLDDAMARLRVSNASGLSLSRAATTDMQDVSAAQRQLRSIRTQLAKIEAVQREVAAAADGLGLREGETIAASAASDAGTAGLDAGLKALLDRIPPDATVADMQDWLKTEIPHLERANMMALDPQTARLVANTVGNLVAELPGITDNLWGILAEEQPYSQALAYVPRDGRSLIINAAMWTDLDNLAERASAYAAQGWWVTQTPEQIIGHEIGHLVQLNYQIENDTWVAAMDQVAAAGGDPLVSQYAGDKIEESFAETFALLVYGQPTEAQLPIAREMADILREKGIEYNDLRAAVGAAPLDLGN